MTAYFVSRHPGAVDWAQRRGIAATRIAHLAPSSIEAGDIVMGTLPVHLACEVCARGARYLHLELDLPADARGRDLSADDMERFGAHLTEFEITRVTP